METRPSMNIEGSQSVKSIFRSSFLSGVTSEGFICKRLHHNNKFNIIKKRRFYVRAHKTIWKIYASFNQLNNNMN